MHEKFINRHDEKQVMGRLTEEFAEVLTALGKSYRFGFDSHDPTVPVKDRESNAAWLLREMDDVLDAIRDAAPFLDNYLLPKERGLSYQNLAAWCNPYSLQNQAVEVGTPDLPPSYDLTFKTVQSACADRDNLWAKGQWTLRDNIVEFNEEFGEFCGNVKRLRRIELGLKTDGKTEAEIKQGLKDELGDCGVVLFNIANKIGLDLGDCIRDKFNKTSVKYGFDVKV